MTSEVAGKITTGAAYAGSSIPAILGLTRDEWQVVGIIIGSLLAILTFLVNLHFKNEHLKIAKLSVKPDIED